MAVKKKILIVNDLLQGGGVEKLMQDLVWHWHDKYDLTVMTYAYFDDFSELYPENVRYISASVKKEYKKNIIEKVYTKIKEKGFRVLFQKRFRKEHFDVAIAIKDGWITKKVDEMNIPVKYAWIHTDYNNYYYTYDLFHGPDAERECMSRFKNIICVSETIKKGVIDVIGDPENLLVKYNPVKVTNILEKAAEEVVDVNPVPDKDVVRFVTVGRLNYQKGYDLLLEASHMLEEDNLKFEVWIIGAEEPWGDEHNRLYRTKKRMNVQNVKFLGGRKNPYKYMKCADWFLSSSIFEGYSLVSQEAAVLDVPLVLTECSGVRELLGESEYGIVIEDISALGIYKAMKNIILNPELHTYYKKKIMERKEIINFEERIKSIEVLIED